ncbi:hypothetical protein [Aurantiacibacter gilvus]|uniref:Uncharacterized protein n=1 Tax=Aurantiacibacter gilvus TaxID=3139141 RepID=A0ABU9IIM3_9SPHN
MFEGKPPFSPEAPSAAAEETAGDALSELTWSDLVAKLEAARDLRASLATAEDATLASFDAGSARHLALHQEPTRHEEYERSVNHDDLGNGKGACGKATEGADRTQPAIRGNT